MKNTISKHTIYRVSSNTIFTMGRDTGVMAVDTVCIGVR
jgi:hypothetical protein